MYDSFFLVYNETDPSTYRRFTDSNRLSRILYDIVQDDPNYNLVRLSEDLNRLPIGELVICGTFKVTKVSGNGRKIGTTK
jgi:hypothetical protein